MPQLAADPARPHKEQLRLAFASLQEEIKALPHPAPAGFAMAHPDLAKEQRLRHALAELGQNLIALTALQKEQGSEN